MADGEPKVKWRSRSGDKVRLYSRPGNDFTKKLTRMPRAGSDESPITPNGKLTRDDIRTRNLDNPCGAFRLFLWGYGRPSPSFRHPNGNGSGWIVGRVQLDHFGA